MCFLQHTQLQLQSQPPYVSHGARVQMPNTLNLKTQILEWLVLSSQRSHTKPFSCSQVLPGCPEPSPACCWLSPPCSEAWWISLRSVFSWLSEPTQPLQPALPCVLFAIVRGLCELYHMYMTLGFQSCSVLTTVFPCVYINLNKHN